MIEHSAELQASEDRFYKLQQRAAEKFGYGSSLEGLHITQTCFERLAQAITERLETPLARNEDEAVYRLLRLLPPHTIALAAINNALQGAMDEDSYVTVAERTGRAINHELFAASLRKHDEKLSAKIETWVKEKHGSLKVRLQSARSIAKKMGFSYLNEWKPAQLVRAGHIALDVMVGALPDVFTLDMEFDTQVIRVTEGAGELAGQAMRQFVRMNPVFLPSIDPPVPWTDFNKGGPVDPVAQRMGSLVRTRHRETVKAVQEAIRSGQMQPALDAINAVQATGWKINTYLLHVIKECQKRGIEVPGLPSREDFPVPTLEDGEWVLKDDDQKKLWRMKKQGIKKANRVLGADRLRYDEDMETADVLAEHDQFFIPHNLDWRGREYPMTNFNFQREDRVRALFLFQNGEPIGEEGIQWLKIHLANCGDFEKVSKKSYEERIKWVDDNYARIRECAMKDWECGGPLTPEALSFWTQADKPFLFLAAALELTRAMTHGPEYVCSLPVSWDGSCSGLQHLCAMTRSEEGRYVNLTDLAEPQDVYQTVADAAFAAIEVEASHVPVAKMAMAYDGNRRKLVKRNVMTTPYGSKKFGMAQQHMDDLMEPLRLEVLQGKRDSHPFGDEWADQKAASTYLATHVHTAIRRIVEKPAKAMQYLQDLAKVVADEGKPLEWVTPIGLPWSNRYHSSEVQLLSLWMHDKGVKVRFRPTVAVDYDRNIDKNRAVNGVAPNFVHACDASHLLLTVIRAVAEGIIQFALVHDSFGCTPSHAARFQGIIREAFVMMYEEHDVLTEVLQGAKCALGEHADRLIECAEKREELTGNLNIKEVLNAKYAFA